MGFNSGFKGLNKSPTGCNNFSVYYPNVCLQLNMFRAFSHPSSGAQWPQWQPLVLFSYRGDSRDVFVILSITFVWNISNSTMNWARFIHSVVCFTTGPKPLPKRVVHIVRSRASSFKCEYPLLSLRSPIASYVFFVVFLSLLSPLVSFLHEIWSKMYIRLRAKFPLFLSNLNKTWIFSKEFRKIFEW